MMSAFFKEHGRDIKIPLTSIKEKVRGLSGLIFYEIANFKQDSFFPVVNSFLWHREHCRKFPLAFIIEKQLINEGTFVLQQGLKSNPQCLQLFLMNEIVHDVWLNTDNKVINIDTVILEPLQ